MISVNVVRNTVLFLLEKENRGYVKPDAFNAFCTMAQFDLFEDLFFQYNQWVNKQNRRLSNSEYADIPKNLREVIDTFATYTTTGNFTYDAGTNLWNYSGSDFYRTENLSLVTTATGKRVDIEEVNKSELNRLNNSSLVAPTVTYPAYVKISDGYRIFPTVPSGYSAELFFIRKPLPVKWTYIDVSGNPVYNASDSTLQDFELPESMFAQIVVKVCLYCGVSIQSQDVVAITNNEEVKSSQEKV